MTDIHEQVSRKCAASREMAARGEKLLALEVVGTVIMPVPFYIREAKGSRVTDVDGNEYIDLTMGFGVDLLGHAPDVVVDAVRAAAGRGMQRGLPGPEQQALAELLIEASPCAERVAFANSGTEATMNAVKAARAFTGKTKIGLFDGCYHGTHDAVMITTDPTSPRERPRAMPLASGTDKRAIENVVLLPYRHEATFELIRENKDELAAVIIEPIQGSNPRLDCGDFLQELRDVCTENDVLLVFDEVITGFRVAYGGGQELFAVTPDLACYGKALGGGLPIGAVAGRADVMESLTLVRRPNPTPPRAFTGGTFSGNPMSMTAGAATLTYLRDHPEVYKYLDEQGARLAGAVNDLCRTEGYRAQMMNASSMFHLCMQDGEIRSARDIDRSHDEVAHLLDLHLLVRGVLLPGIHLVFTSTAHTPEDIDAVADAYAGSFAALRQDGRL